MFKQSICSTDKLSVIDIKKGLSIKDIF